MKDKKATRREFFFRAGAAASLPATFALVTPANARSDTDMPQRLAELEDGNALRLLMAEFVALVNSESTVYSPLQSSVAEIMPSNFDLHASVRVDADRLHAEVSLPCAVTINVPIDAPDSVLLDMAQLQGEGQLKQQRAQTLRLACRRAENQWAVVSAVLEDVV